MKALESKHTFTPSIDIIDAGYCVRVHFREYRVIWRGQSIFFFRLHEVNGCDPVLTVPCGRSVSLWVGGLDVKASFVPKNDIVGLVLVALFNGREPLFLKIM